MAIGAIYLWTYVYNIVCVYSSKSSDVMSEPEINLDNLFKRSQGPLITPEYSSEVNAHVNQLEIECSTVPERSPGVRKIMKQIKALSGKLKLMKALLAPSTIGSVAGLIIGTVPQLQRLLVGDNAPLHVVQNSASMIGDAAIPSITLIVGENLLKAHRDSGFNLIMVDPLWENASAHQKSS